MRSRPWRLPTVERFRRPDQPSSAVAACPAVVRAAAPEAVRAAARDPATFPAARSLGGAFPGGPPPRLDGNGQVLPGGPPVNPPGGPGVGQRGGIGGLLNAAAPNSAVIAALSANADRYTWVAATIGSNNAAGYQLATGLPVMPIGGFNGSDPSPTLAQFQQYVAEGRIHYFLGGGGFNANGGSRAAQEIAAWVTQNFTATTIGGVTLYDFTTR